MTSFKTSKKHHTHINHPFPSNPKTLPLIQGSLVFDPKTLPPHQVYDIGHDFQLNWSSSNGGSLSLCRKPNLSRSIWSTVPGRAFVSAAAADTEVQESRGSFLVKDTNIRLVCNHQTVDEIRLIQKSDLEEPALLIKGRVFSGKRGSVDSGSLEVVEKKLGAYAKYWMVFDQKSSDQVGFQVRFGRPNSVREKAFSARSYGYRGFARKLGRIRRLRVGWSGYFLRKRVVVAFPQEEENMVMKKAPCLDLNRIFLTYSSERSERFYGFGEQFSHMDLKGKRVPMLVQEQGIGRGDQPITFAANLVSYRAGGDEITTYAPSPFYITSKMRSLYLEGYNYSVFDLTNDELVQIQMYGDMLEGRILNGNSPLELIERFTETIGRPQELPEWIISGAVVGLQGGTDVVRDIWDQLQAMETPISAFWLQDWVGQRNTVIGSQLWWNWEVDSTRYSGWRQMIEELSAQKIKVMTYCNPCLAPVSSEQ